jgi:hypothetical protein
MAFNYGSCCPSLQKLNVVINVQFHFITALIYGQLMMKYTINCG